MDHVIERILLSLFQDAQHRLDVLQTRFPGHETAVEEAFREGASFYTSRAADLEQAAQSGMTVDEFKAVERQWMQHRAAGLN